MHASSPDIDRRVTFDRAVWTKPLAFAADAVESAMSVQSWEPRVARPCGDRWGRQSRVRRGRAHQRPDLRGRPSCPGDTPPAQAHTSATDRDWRGVGAAYEVS